MQNQPTFQHCLPRFWRSSRTNDCRGMGGENCPKAQQTTRRNQVAHFAQNSPYLTLILNNSEDLLIEIFLEKWICTKRTWRHILTRSWSTALLTNAGANVKFFQGILSSKVKIFNQPCVQFFVNLFGHQLYIFWCFIQDPFFFRGELHNQSRNKVALIIV